MATQWTLDDLYRRVMRFWVVLVSTMAGFIVVSAGVFFVFPQTYTAAAQHTVEPITVLSSGSSFNTVNMETERVVATSTAVLKKASEKLGGTSVSTLRSATVIEVPRNSQVLIFQVTANTADKAAEWANALATAYGQQRTENARIVLDQTSTELDDSIAKLQALYESLPAGSNARSATQLQLQALLDQQARLTSTPLFSGMLVTPADVPSKSNRPSILVFIAAGLFLGTLVGGIAALLTSRFRRDSESTPDVARSEAADVDIVRFEPSGPAADDRYLAPQEDDPQPLAKQPEQSSIR